MPRLHTRGSTRALHLVFALLGLSQVAACFLFEEDEEAAALHLSVVSARQTIERIGGELPRSGELYVIAELSMVNDTDQSVSLLPTQFKLRSESGVEYSGSPVTELADGSCGSDTSIGAGGHAKCVVVFEAPVDITTVSVSLAWPSGSAKAPLATKACGLCGGQCFDLDTDSTHCGDCNQPVGYGTCVDGEPECDEGKVLCGTRCVDLSSDGDHCGACDVELASDVMCVGGAPTCRGTKTDCGGGCIDLRGDVANCGACGRVCPGEPPSPQWPGTTCNGGLCSSFLTVFDRVSCDSVCAGYGLACTSAYAVYGPGSGYSLDLACSAVAADYHYTYNATFSRMQCSCSG